MAKNAVVRTQAGEWTGTAIAQPFQSLALVATGTNQATGLQLVDSKEYYQFATVAASTATLLPKGASPGDEVFIVNSGANALLVFPQVGGSLNSTSANSSVSLAVGKSMHAYALTALNWVVVVSA